MDRKEYHNESHVALAHVLSQAIWPDDIEEMKRQIQIGDVIKVMAIKGGDDLGNRHKEGTEKYGRVVDKQEFYLTVEFKYGLRESFTWVEMVQNHRDKIEREKKKNGKVE